MFQSELVWIPAEVRSLALFLKDFITLLESCVEHFAVQWDNDTEEGLTSISLVVHGDATVYGYKSRLLCAIETHQFRYLKDLAYPKGSANLRAYHFRCIKSRSEFRTILKQMSSSASLLTSHANMSWAFQGWSWMKSYISYR